MCNCKEVWASAPDRLKAAALDSAFPNCSCESNGLSTGGAGPVLDDEVVARIITSPDGYDCDRKELVRAKLTAIYSSGLSIIRQNASDEEIELTVRQQTVETTERNRLVGAAIMRARDIRYDGVPPRRFCLYDTDEPNKAYHADILAPTPQGGTNQREQAKKKARKQLEKLLMAHLVEVSSTSELIVQIRAAAHGAPGGHTPC